MADLNSSDALIARANRLLDTLRVPKSEEAALDAIDELEQLKEDMGSRGFAAPYAALANAARNEDLEEDEVRELKKQLRKMKEFANAKRFTLNRVIVALSANRIALRLLQRNATTMLPLLPLGGNYISQLVRHGEHAVSAYARLLDDLAAAGSELERSVIVKIERDVEGKPVQETLKLMSDQKIEERVRRAYGADARVVSTQVRTEGELLVRSKSVRACIAAAYAALAAISSAKEFDAELKKDHRMRDYVEILNAHGFSDLSALEDDDDKYFEIMGALEKKGLAVKAKAGYVLDENIEAHVEARRHHLRGRTSKLAETQLAQDLFRYYLSTPSRKRESEPLFPGLAPTLTLKQVRMFAPLAKEMGVKDPASLVLEKMDAERVSAGIKGDLFGAALFSLRSSKPAKWCAEFFGVGEEELKQAREKVQVLLGGAKEGTERSRKFMELVKGARNKGKKQ